MAALEVYRTGLDKFPSEVTFLTGVARIYEAIGNLSLSAKYYKILLVVSVPWNVIPNFNDRRVGIRAVSIMIPKESYF